MKPLGLGVVGCGVIAIQSVFEHFEVGDLGDRVYLEACCDPVPGRAKEAAEKWGIKTYYEDLDEMLKNENVDIVTICSPISLHYEQGLKCIKAGKGVHFNKTMSLTSAEAGEMIAEAEKRGVKLVVSPGMMLYTVNRKVRKALLNGEIGDIIWAFTGGSGVMFYHVEEQLRQGGKIVPTWYYKQPSGGPMYDSTIYNIHALVGIMGPVKRVSCMAGQIMKSFQYGDTKIDSEVDDNLFMLLDFGDSRFAMLYSGLKGEPVQTMPPSIFGTKGEVNNGCLNGVKLFEGRDKMGSLNISEAQRKLPQPHVFADVMQLVDAVREDKPIIATAEMGRHCVEIIEAGFESAKTGRVVELRTTFTPLPLEELD